MGANSGMELLNSLRGSSSGVPVSLVAQGGGGDLRGYPRRV